jgi:hypothetical protein
MKRTFLVLTCIVFHIACFAFDYTFGLREKNFNDIKYNFTLVKVVDARLNKQKPIGSLMTGFALHNETVGNDSLEEQMNLFFKNRPEIFEQATKVIMVINQLNLRYIKERNDATGKKEELELSIAIDYYLSGDKTCGLLYQQFFKFRESIATTISTRKGLDVAFSETIKGALKDFKKQLDTYKPLVRKEYAADSLFQSFSNKPAQVVSNQNIKDGLYFSCKDIYLNKPGVLSNYALSDSLGLGRVVIVKSSDYVVDRVYTIVKAKKIYVYIGGGKYKEALLNDEGKLFFPDVTSTTLSNGAAVGSAVVGIASSFFPLGFIGSLFSNGVESSVKKAGTTTSVSDIIIDYETGDLIKKP